MAMEKGYRGAAAKRLQQTGIVVKRFSTAGYKPPKQEEPEEENEEAEMPQDEFGDEEKE